MSPSQPTARKSAKNYTPAVRKYLAQLGKLDWQAQSLDAEYWQVLTAKGETLAIVNDTVTQPHISTQQAAQLMADAPLLLKELLLTHRALCHVASRVLLLTEQKVGFNDLKLATERNEQRLALLGKYRDLIHTDTQDNALNANTNKEQSHD
ncbi:MAG: hypothetical protein H6996_05290 [Moraxellaceae bacterium]|nr:hypothetical protein [Moraxellaceae bacterium]